MAEVDDEAPRLTATAGWMAPSDQVAFLLENDDELHIPEVSVLRGGPRWGEASVATTPRPAPEPADPRGHWEYGVDVSEDGEEPEIVSGEGSYYGEFTRFRSAQEAYDYGGGTVYKRWVPAPGPWDEVH